MTAPISDKVLRETLKAVAKHGSPAEAAAALGIKTRALDARLQMARERGLEVKKSWQKGLTEDQTRETLEAYEKSGGNFAEAARLIGITRMAFKSRYETALRHPSVQNLEPFLPPGQGLRGVSTLYNNQGEMVAQWVKTRADFEKQLEILRETVESLKEDIPREKPVKFDGHSNADLLSTYIVTDYHVGLMAWAGEAGEDWNTDKAIQFLVAWFESAIEAAPDSEVAILCELGDFLHFDSMDPVTPTSRHIMDTDARFCRLVPAVVEALRIIIKKLLKKHKRLIIILGEGNHDMTSSIWLRAMFSIIYENEPRVTVDKTEVPYYAFEWGQTSIFFHHGHKKRLKEVSKTFAGIFREIYGRTKYSYAHMGHLHHVESKEDAMMIVEQHPSMAPKAAHDARGGYQSLRGASVITYSKKFGEVSRVTIRPEMVQPAAA